MTKDCFGRYWNRCIVCGRFISYEDFENGSAERYMVTPDTQFSVEKFENICKRCVRKLNE